MSIFNKKTYWGIDGVVCPFCFEKFNGNDVHFRHRSGINVEKVNDTIYSRYNKGKEGAGDNMPIYYIPTDEEKVGRGAPGKIKFKLVKKNNAQYNCMYAYKQPDDDKYTSIALCPHCHNPLNQSILEGKSKTISVLGYTQIGKTHYIVSLVQYLNEQAPKERARNLHVSILHGEQFYVEKREKYKNNQLSATDKTETVEPIVMRLWLEATPTMPEKEVILSFYDFAGESDMATINALEHFENADAYMLLFDLTKTETFRTLYLDQQMEETAAQLQNLGNGNDEAIARIRRVIDESIKEYLLITPGVTNCIVWNDVLRDVSQTGMAAELVRGIALNLFAEDSKNIREIREKLIGETVSHQRTSGIGSADIAMNGFHSAPSAPGENWSTQTDDFDSYLHHILAEESITPAQRLQSGLSSRPISKKRNAREAFVSSVLNAFQENNIGIHPFTRGVEKQFEDLYDYLQGDVLSDALGRAETIQKGRSVLQRQQAIQMKRRRDGKLGKLFISDEKSESDANILQRLSVWLNKRFFAESEYDSRNPFPKPTAFVGTKSDEIVGLLGMMINDTDNQIRELLCMDRERCTEYDLLERSKQAVKQMEPMRADELRTLWKNRTKLQNHKKALESTANPLSTTYYLQEFVRAMDENVREMLWGTDQPEHVYLTRHGISQELGGPDTETGNAIESQFSNSMVFAVSALGTYYEIDEWGQSQRHAQNTTMCAANVAEPLFWLLNELGFFS